MSKYKNYNLIKISATEEGQIIQSIRDALSKIFNYYLNTIVELGSVSREQIVPTIRNLHRQIAGYKMPIERSVNNIKNSRVKQRVNSLSNRIFNIIFSVSSTKPVLSDVYSGYVDGQELLQKLDEVKNFAEEQNLYYQAFPQVEPIIPEAVETSEAEMTKKPEGFYEGDVPIRYHPSGVAHTFEDVFDLGEHGKPTRKEKQPLTKPQKQKMSWEDWMKQRGPEPDLPVIYKGVEKLKTRGRPKKKKTKQSKESEQEQANPYSEIIIESGVSS